MSNYYIPPCGLLDDYDSFYGTYRTNLFGDVFPNVTRFKEAYNNIGLGGLSTDAMITQVYKLLFAHYANDAIYASDENRFKHELFSIIFEYGPAYEAKYNLQKSIQNLTDDEIQQGSIQISNFSENPSTLPTSQDFEQLRKINSQTASGWKKSKLEALQLKDIAIDTKYIAEFLNKFKHLFNPFPPERPLIYNVEVFTDGN